MIDGLFHSKCFVIELNEVKNHGHLKCKIQGGNGCSLKETENNAHHICPFMDTTDGIQAGGLCCYNYDIMSLKLQEVVLKKKN